MIIKTKYPIPSTLSELRIIYGYINRIIQKSCKKMNAPWMSIEEIDVIVWLLKHLKPRACMEWGAGYSTLYFPKFLNQNARWISIEHMTEWYSKITQLNKNKNVSIFNVKPNYFPWTDINNDGCYSDLKDYIHFVDKRGPFDFILVDGRAREDCLKKAHEVLDEKGIVILHDAQRKHYHRSFDLYKYKTMLSEYYPDGRQLWLGSKALNVHSLIDLEKCKNLWRFNYFFIEKGKFFST